MRPSWVNKDHLWCRCFVQDPEITKLVEEVRLELFPDKSTDSALVAFQGYALDIDIVLVLRRRSCCRKHSLRPE